MVSHHGIYNSNASNTYQTWSKGEGNSKPPQLSCLENPTNSMKRQKYMTLKDELPKSVDAQYATGDDQRNCSRRNEEAEPKWNSYRCVWW